MKKALGFTYLVDDILMEVFSDSEHSLAPGPKLLEVAGVLLYVSGVSSVKGSPEGRTLLSLARKVAATYGELPDIYTVPQGVVRKLQAVQQKLDSLRADHGVNSDPLRSIRRPRLRLVPGSEV